MFAERQPSKVEPATNADDPTGEVSWPIGSLSGKVRNIDLLRSVFIIVSVSWDDCSERGG